MIVYFILIVLLASFSLSRSRILLFIFCVLMILIAGLRDISVGTDTATYSEIFSIIKNGSYYWAEPLWNYLNLAVIKLGGDFQVLLLSTSLLITVPIYYVTSKISCRPILSILFYVLLYYYFFSFNILRQSIAVSFILLSYYLLSISKKKQALFFLFIALLFHKSSIIIFPVFLLNIKKIHSQKFYILLTAGSVLLGLIAPLLLSDVIHQFYPNYIIEGLNVDNFFRIIFKIFYYNLLFLIIFLFDKFKNVWFNYYWFGILIINTFVLFPFSERIIFSIGIINTIYFANVIFTNKNKNKIIIAISVLVYSILYFTLNITKNAGDIIPYTISA